MPKFERVVKIDGAECKLLVQAQDVATYREIERPHMLHIVIGETVLYSLHVTPQEAGAMKAATIGVPYAINRAQAAASDTDGLAKGVQTE